MYVCKSVDTTVRKRRLLFAGGAQRTTDERLTRRVTFATMAGGEKTRDQADQEVTGSIAY